MNWVAVSFQIVNERSSLMQFIGCDVSKMTLDLAWFDEDKRRWGGRLKVPNNSSGWQDLMQWAEQCCWLDQCEICVVMEATGVYHLPVAGYLSAQGFKVLVCNPGRSADYARSQNQLNKSDQLDARALQRYGSRLEKVHWYQPDTPQISQLKSLLGLLDQLDKDVMRWQNRWEKITYQHPGSVACQGIRRQLKNLCREQVRTQKAIDRLIQGDEELRCNQRLMCSIKGVGAKTSQRLLPLVQGGRFESARQLAAFLGLTPCHKTSGTSLRSPGQLSGRGDANLRSKLYMPALCACYKNPELSVFYNTLLTRGKTEKQAITAVMRKLVHLCYGVVKNQTPYIENYGALS
jgi:transposase